MCKTKMKTNLYYVNICKHEHEMNMTRLWCKIIFVTLALGLRPMQGLTKVWGSSVKPNSHISCSGIVERCEGMNPHTLKWAPFSELKSRWISEFLDHDCKGQNSLD